MGSGDFFAFWGGQNTLFSGLFRIQECESGHVFSGTEPASYLHTITDFALSRILSIG
jgi:hypothetical protein